MRAPPELRRMQELVQELWRLKGPYVGTHVGDLAWGSTHLGAGPAWNVRIWNRGGRAVAAAWMRRPGELEYEVHPEHRPLQDEILQWAGDGRLTVYSLSADDRRLAYLAERGFRPADDAKALDFHRRALADVEPVDPPPGFRLRTVEPGDFERRVAVHRVAWAPSKVTSESYRDVTETWPYRADLDCVAEAPDGSFAASCLVWLDEANGVGELEPVGTAPQYRRRGLGAAVCRFALRRLREEGAAAAVVYSNTRPAAALYESIGFRRYTRAIARVRNLRVT